MPRKVYSDEFKRAAVEQVVVQRHSLSSVAQRLGVGYDSLRKWVELAKFNADQSLIPTDLPPEQRIRELEKENARLRMERDILKKATAYFAKEHLVKFAYIRDHRKVFDVAVMCAVFGVTPAGFYAWLQRPDSPRTVRARELAEQIRVVHREVKGVYGSLKITRELRHRRVMVNRKTVARLMHRLGIRSKVAKKFRVQTTDSVHPNPIAPNVLDQRFASASAPDQVWGADITYLHTDEGFLYLAGVMDLYSRKIVGWSMSDSLTTTLVEDAFTAALLSRKPALGLLHHSDRGVQYTSGRYRELLERHGIKASMSRAGNCYDNAVVESFWGKLKTEMVHHEHFATKAQARAAVFEYIEMFYNRRRLHAALGYLSPEAFEASRVR